MSTLRHRRWQRQARTAAWFLWLALAAATTGCGYRDLGDMKTANNAVWGEISQVYAARSSHADEAIAAVSQEAGFDPLVASAARGALERAAALPARPQLIDDPEAIGTFQQNQGDLTAALFRLVDTAQQFDALRDNTAVLTLRYQLVQAETQLAAARERYSRSASNYNALTRAFPSAVTAKLLGFGSVPAHF